MIRFYYHPTPNPVKVALFLEETSLAYEVVPIDTGKGQQHFDRGHAERPESTLNRAKSSDQRGPWPGRSTPRGIQFSSLRRCRRVYFSVPTTPSMRTLKELP